MIQQQDIIVGRYFIYKDGPAEDIIKLTPSIIRDMFAGRGSYAIEKFEGIRLTEELLKKVKFPEFCVYDLDRKVGPDPKVYWLTYCGVKVKWSKQVVYLNQFQNLIFNLTEQELIVDL